MSTTPKPPEVLQAQVMSYAQEGTMDHMEKVEVYKALGQLTGNLPSDPANNYPDKLSAGYVAYLRESGGSNHDSIQSRAKLLVNYSRFTSAVEAVLPVAADPETRVNHPDYLGSGAMCDAFKITVEDKEHAVRIPRELPRAQTADLYFRALQKGQGIPHLEQIEAMSYHPVVTVSKFMPGVPLEVATNQTFSGITDEQLGDLIDTIALAYNAGIDVDSNDGNYYYDKDAGFGIIDYSVIDDVAHPKPAQTLAGQIKGSANVLANAGLWDGETFTLDESKTETVLVHLELLDRYAQACEKKFTGTTLDEIKAGIDTIRHRLIASSSISFNTDQPDGLPTMRETSSISHNDVMSMDTIVDALKSEREPIDFITMDILEDDEFLSALSASVGPDAKEYIRHSMRYALASSNRALFGPILTIPESPDVLSASGIPWQEESGALVDLVKIKQAGVDPSHVLYFRVTQPASQPKPERFWTNDLSEVRGGLRVELGGDAETAIILVSTLEEISKNGGLIRDINDDNGIAVRQIGSNTFDQAACLTTFARNTIQ